MASADYKSAVRLCERVEYHIGTTRINMAKMSSRTTLSAVAHFLTSVLRAQCGSRLANMAANAPYGFMLATRPTMLNVP